MAQAPRRRSPAVLEPATHLAFPAEADSNSPGFWRLRNGVTTLTILNLTGGRLGGDTAAPWPRRL
jgi:hypothetical protein